MNFKNNKNNWMYLLNCIVVLSFLTVFGTFSVLHERPTFSSVERRKLKSMPKFSFSEHLKGNYTDKISEFFADTFPMREKFIKIAGRISLVKGFNYGNIRIHDVDIDEAENTTDDDNNITDISDFLTISDESLNEENESEISDNKKERIEEHAIRNGAIYVYKGKGYSIFGGLESMGNYYAQTLNGYNNDLKNTVKVYNLIVPSSIEFGLPEKYRTLSVPQHERILDIYSKLNDNISKIDIYNTLKKHMNEYIYFGTDHHWTSLGAYYAYVEFAKTAGFIPTDMDKMTKRTLTDFIGTLYSQTNDNTMLSNPDYVDYYIMPVGCKAYQYLRNSPYTPRQVTLYGEYALPVNSYSVFLHGDFPLSKIVTENKNGKKIAVVKDSYGNAFIPFLVNNYEEIYVVDERYFQTDLMGLIKQNNIKELLFLSNVFSAHSAYHIKNIARIKNQPYIPYVPKEDVPKEEIKDSDVDQESEVSKS